MKRSVFLIVVLVVVSIYALDANLREFILERGSTVDVTPSNTSLISFDCAEETIVIKKGEIKWMSILNISNGLGYEIFVENIEYNCNFPDLRCTTPYQIGSGDTVDFNCVFDSRNVDAGSYDLQPSLVVFWEGGSAEIPLCSVKIIVKQHETAWAVPDNGTPLEQGIGWYFETRAGVVPIIAGNEIVGSLNISRDQDNLKIEVLTENGWILVVSHLYVGDVPPKFPGNLNYAHAPFSNRDIFIVTPGEYIAFHAEVEKPGGV
jgi:hypothetical protein